MIGHIFLVKPEKTYVGLRSIYTYNLNHQTITTNQYLSALRIFYELKFTSLHMYIYHIIYSIIYSNKEQDVTAHFIDFDGRFTTVFINS